MNVSTFVAIPAVYSASLIIFGVVTKVEPTILKYTFAIYERFEWPILLIILIGILGFISLYAKSLIEQE